MSGLWKDMKVSLNRVTRVAIGIIERTPREGFYLDTHKLNVEHYCDVQSLRLIEKKHGRKF